MRPRLLPFGVCAVVFLIWGAETSFAQAWEVHPYAGGFFASEWRDQFKLRNQGMFGVKVGGFATENIEWEANLGYMNHFEFQDTSNRTRALIYDVGPTWNFFDRNFRIGFSPYVNASVGAVTARVNTAEGDVTGDDKVDILAGARVTSPTQSHIMSNGDTFFALSYGGGVKSLRLKGPLGLRFDVRGRSLPNFFGNSVTWLETTAGVTFSWGEL
jgi:hypothetical protein